jgi:ParB/RepB/Spo0J family partition protein
VPELTTIPVDSITPDPDNARADIGDLTGLIASIRSLGVIQPIVVRSDGNTGWIIVAGHRRHAAALAAGIAEVPVVVREDVTDEERLATFVAENLHRADITPVDRAHVFAQLLDLPGTTQRDVAVLCGVSQPTVSKSVALLKLPPKAQQWVADGSLSLDDAATMASLPAATIKTWCSRHLPPTTHTIDEAKRRQKDIDAADRKLDELEQSGARVIRDTAPTSVWTATPKIANTMWLRNRDAYDGHSDLACHAWMRPSWGTEPEAVCTQPADHLPAAPAAAPADDGTPSAASPTAPAGGSPGGTAGVAEPAPTIDVAAELRLLAEHMTARFDLGVAMAHAAPFVTMNVDIGDAWDEASHFTRFGDDIRVGETMSLDGVPAWLARNPGAAARVLYALALGDSIIEIVSAVRTGNNSRVGRHVAHFRSHPAYRDVLSADAITVLASLTETPDSSGPAADDTDIAEAVETAAGPVVAVICDDTSKTPYAVDCTECDHIARHSNEAAATQRAETHIANAHSGVGTVRLASPDDRN